MSAANNVPKLFHHSHTGSWHTYDAPLEQQVLDIPQAERTPHVNHHYEIPWGLGSDPF